MKKEHLDKSKNKAESVDFGPRNFICQDVSFHLSRCVVSFVKTICHWGETICHWDSDRLSVAWKRLVIVICHWAQNDLSLSPAHSDFFHKFESERTSQNFRSRSRMFARERSWKLLAQVFHKSRHFLELTQVSLKEKSRSFRTREFSPPQITPTARKNRSQVSHGNRSPFRERFLCRRGNDFCACEQTSFQLLLGVRFFASQLLLNT